MNRPKRILLVIFDNLGDVVMSTAVLKPLRAQFPDAVIGLWTKAYTAELFHSHSMIDHIYGADPFWDKSPGRGKGSFFHFLSSLNKVRHDRYDVALVLNAEWRRSMFSRFTGAAESIGYIRRKSQLFLTSTFKEPTGLHCADEHVQLISRWLKIPAMQPGVPRLDLSQAEKQWAQNWFAQIGWNPKSVMAIHPFAGNPNRWWPEQNWRELIGHVLNSDPSLHIVVLSDVQDKALMRDFQLSERVEIFCGEPLAKTKALLGSVRLFVGNDSGPGHIAAALGTPVVSLFGPTDPARYAPRGLSPVSVRRENPIDALPLETVFSAVDEMLSKTAELAS